MASRFTQNFTLTDIFNNKKLKDKLPLINYKEIEREDEKFQGEQIQKLSIDWYLMFQQVPQDLTTSP